MQVPQYLLPKVGVATNEIELKLNQQRLLHQNYTKNLPQVSQQRRYPEMHLPLFRNQLSDLNPFKSDQIQPSYNLLLQKSFSQPHISKNIHAQIIKNSLSNQLSQQIALKEQLKKYEKKEQMKIEQQIVQHNKFLENKELMKENSFKENFKQEAKRFAELKELRKKSQKQFQQLEKKSYDQLYKNNYQIVQKRILGLQDASKPSIPKLDRISQSQLSDYIHNPETGILPKLSMHKPNWEESTKLRENLKESLIEQMKINSEKKKIDKIKQWNTPFVDEKYKNLDNPIINPIDIKIAKDNKYIMKELLGPKLTMGKAQTPGSNGKISNQRGNQLSMENQPSYLSRRGSSSLSKLGLRHEQNR